MTTQSGSRASHNPAPPPKKKQNWYLIVRVVAWLIKSMEKKQIVSRSPTHTCGEKKGHDPKRNILTRSSGHARKAHGSLKSNTTLVPLTRGAVWRQHTRRKKEQKDKTRQDTQVRVEPRTFVAFLL